MEDNYVNFESCKLLKQFGFDQDYYCHPVWWMNGNNPQLSFEGDNEFPYGSNVCCGCTNAEALKFFREKYKLNVEIVLVGLVLRSDIPVDWKYRIYDSANNIEYRTNEVSDIYEEIESKAITKCLSILEDRAK